MTQQTTSRTAIVTGAAGGIGAATVSRLLASGYSVLAVDRNEAELTRLWSGQGGVIPMVQDVASADAPKAIVDAALKNFGRLDALANIAGIGAAKAVHETNDEDLERFLQINFRSLFRVSREALRAMTKGASIVNISSTFGLVGFPVSSSYAATKAAVVGLTRQMAVDYGPQGIRVNAVAPGLISSPLTKERISSNPLYQNLLIRGTPFYRIGETSDIANAVNFLFSDEAAFINGHVLAVDGGWSSTRYLADA